MSALQLMAAEASSAPPEDGGGGAGRGQAGGAEVAAEAAAVAAAALAVEGDGAAGEELAKTIAGLVKDNDGLGLQQEQGGEL